MEPLFLDSPMHEKIWGGNRLKTEFGYDISSEHTGEYWAISAHPNGVSYVKNGKYAGFHLAELYKDKPELSKLLRENTWSNNLHIISKTKSYEEKEFYLKLASKEKYKAKELARQIDSGYYERLLLSNGKATSAIESKEMTGVLRDMYMLEFLDLSEPYKEKKSKR